MVSFCSTSGDANTLQSEKANSVPHSSLAYALHLTLPFSSGHFTIRARTPSFLRRYSSVFFQCVTGESVSKSLVPCRWPRCNPEISFNITIDQAAANSFGSSTTCDSFTPTSAPKLWRWPLRLGCTGSLEQAKLWWLVSRSGRRILLGGQLPSVYDVIVIILSSNHNIAAPSCQTYPEHMRWHPVRSSDGHRSDRRFK